MSAPYPPLEPYADGLLDVGDGHHLYWETCGQPDGRPALVLHGGPGSGCTAGMRRFFDPARYRIVLVDQRGCGRSTPHAGEPAADLSANTTAHLLDDIEVLREHLGVDRWVLFGMSWGCTLGLAYAERHPARVAAAVFAGVTTGRRRELDWMYDGVRLLYPAEWERLRDGVAPEHRDGDLIGAYHRLLHDPDPAVHRPAAQRWSEYEWSLTAPDAGELPPAWRDPRFQLGRARIVTHYFVHDLWLDDGVLLRDARALAGIPGILVNGRLDVQSPLLGAWELARAWPGSELVIVEGAGHSSADRRMAAAIVAATDRLAGGSEM